MTDRRTVKKSILKDIEKIQNGLKEKNDAQRDVIQNQLINLIDLLKKHIIDKQNKLDRYIDRLQQLTKDKVACSLLDTLDNQLKETGNDYTNVLKFEAEDKTLSSDPKNLGVMIEISSRLYNAISKLETIEDTVEDIMKKY